METWKVILIYGMPDKQTNTTLHIRLGSLMLANNYYKFIIMIGLNSLNYTVQCKRVLYMQLTINTECTCTLNTGTVYVLVN